VPTNPVVTFDMIVGAVVADCRQRAGATQTAVAAGAGMTQSALSKLERGRCPLTAGDVSRLVGVINFTIGPNGESRTAGGVLDMAERVSGVASEAGVTVLMRPSISLPPAVRIRLLGRVALSALLARANGGAT